MRDLVRIYNISNHNGKMFGEKSENESENEEKQIEKEGSCFKNICVEKRTGMKSEKQRENGEISGWK